MQTATRGRDRLALFQARQGSALDAESLRTAFSDPSLRALLLRGARIDEITGLLRELTLGGASPKKTERPTCEKTATDRALA